MSNHPSISIDTPASRLVTVDSLYLRLMYDRIQDIYRDTGPPSHRARCYQYKRRC